MYVPRKVSSTLQAKLTQYLNNPVLCMAPFYVGI